LFDIAGVQSDAGMGRHGVAAVGKCIATRENKRRSISSLGDKLSDGTQQAPAHRRISALVAAGDLCVAARMVVPDSVFLPRQRFPRRTDAARLWTVISIRTGPGPVRPRLPGHLE